MRNVLINKGKFIFISFFFIIFLFLSFSYTEYEKFKIVEYRNNQININYILDKKLLTYYLLILKLSDGNIFIEDQEISTIFSKYINDFDITAIESYKEKLSILFDSYKYKKTNDTYYFYMINYIHYRNQYFTKYNDLVNLFLNKFNIKYRISNIKDYLNSNIRDENDLSKFDKIKTKYNEFFKDSEVLYSMYIFSDIAIETDDLLSALYNSNIALIDKICVELEDQINKEFNFFIDSDTNNILNKIIVNESYVYIYFAIFSSNYNENFSYSDTSDNKNNFITFSLMKNINYFSLYLTHEYIHLLYSNISSELFEYSFNEFKDEILNNCLDNLKLEYYLPLTVNPFYVNFIPLIRSKDFLNGGEFVKVYFENYNKFLEKLVNNIFNEFFAYTYSYYLYKYKFNKSENFILIKLYLDDYVSNIDYIKQKYLNIYYFQQYLVSKDNNYLEDIINHGLTFKTILPIFKLFVFSHKYPLNTALELLK